MTFYNSPLSYDNTFSDLIEARYQVIYSDFDARTFKQWRQKAIAYLTTIVGPDHVYTRYFKDFVRQGGRKGLLAGVGILSAAKEQASSKWSRIIRASGNVTSVPYAKRIEDSQKS
ncbi:MAG: hypothetical protein ACYDHG_08130 [Desulfomonilaceae bacterium]